MFDAIGGFIGGLIYPLFSIIFLFINILQNIFYVFAGVGVDGRQNTINFGNQPITNDNDGGTNSTGLIYHMLQTDLIKNLLISIMILGVFLLIIFTAMAFIKSAYSDKPKTWQTIVGNAIKGLANFIFVPVCCLLGIWLGNIVLGAINGATSSGGASYMDRKLFIAAAYNANSFRLNNQDQSEIMKDESKYNRVCKIYAMAYLEDAGWNPSETSLNNAKSHVKKDQTYGYYANLVDQCYGQGEISIYEWYSVEQGYQLFSINYLVLIVGGVFMMFVLVSLAYAMIRRMFILLMLFVISPALCGMYPLDEGKAVGSWKGDFIKQVTSAYSAVAGMNLFFSLLPLIDKINFGSYFTFFGKTGGMTGIVDSLVQLIILICGLMVVKEFISMITGYIGGENAYDKGASMRSSIKKTGKEQYKNAKDKISGATSGAFRLGYAAKNGTLKQYLASKNKLSELNPFAGSVKSAKEAAQKDIAAKHAGLQRAQLNAIKSEMNESIKKIKKDNTIDDATRKSKIQDAQITAAKQAADLKLEGNIYQMLADQLNVSRLSGVKDENLLSGAITLNTADSIKAEMKASNDVDKLSKSLSELRETIETAITTGDHTGIKDMIYKQDKFSDDQIELAESDEEKKKMREANVVIDSFAGQIEKYKSITAQLEEPLTTLAKATYTAYAGNAKESGLGGAKEIKEAISKLNAGNESDYEKIVSAIEKQTQVTTQLKEKQAEMIQKNTGEVLGGKEKADKK